MPSGETSTRSVPAGHRSMLVAVGDSDVRSAALAYAADVALREGRALRLVHVSPPSGARHPEMMLLDVEAAAIVGHNLLNSAEARVHALTDGTIDVEALTRRGPVVDILVDLARDAERVVLQHRRQSRLRRVLTGSIAAGVAGRSTVPVVSVPEYWSSWTLDQPHLTAGMRTDSRNDALLDRAFAVASACHGTLTALSAWAWPAPYDKVSGDPSAVRTWTSHVGDLLSERLAPWRVAYPSLDIRIDVRHMRPADALVAATRHSDLLLLGRGHQDGYGQLGPLTRALILEALCPVEVVPDSFRSGRSSGTSPAAQRSVSGA